MNSKMKIERLDNIIDFKNGKIAPKENGNIPIYGGNGILGYTNKFNYENIIIVGRVGAYCGSVHIERGKCWVSDNAIAGIHKNIDSNYYNFYLLKSLYLNKYQIGSSQPLLTQGILNLIEVKIHNNFNDQIEIGDFVSKIDVKIDINNKINVALEGMAKTLYDYWFVQFDFPDTNGKPYQSSGGKMVWNEKLKKEIPEDWKVELFSEWINNDKSGDWGKEQAEGNYTEKVYCIRGADINGLNGIGELKSPERYILEKNLHKTLDPADLIVEISGGSPTQSTGRLAFITDETLARFDAPIICSNFCKAVTLKNKKLLYNFVYHWKSIYDAGVLFGYEGKTSGIKNLLFDSFVNSHYTLIPRETVAEKFHEFMEPTQAKMQKNLKENKELTSLRNWLLPMLINGQIKVNFN